MADELESLIEEGCATILDDKVYFDWPRFRALHPVLAEEMWKVHCQEIDKSIISLVDQGLVEISFEWNEHGEPEEVYSVTELGRAVQQHMFEQEINEMLGLDTDD